MANELSIELSYEDVKAAILKYGFQIEVNQFLFPPDGTFTFIYEGCVHACVKLSTLKHFGLRFKYFIIPEQYCLTVPSV